MMELPLVIDIKRYSFEDGPGIRSVVFFKGCPLRCIFCHNPEAQKPGPEIAFSKAQCIECGACEQACPLGAVGLEFPGRVHRDRCDRCGKCAEVCPTDALKLIGTHYSVESLTEVLLRDFEYYRYSGGGVTLSGGECTIFPEYLEALLQSLKAKGIHIVMETSGYFNYRSFRQKIYPYLDLIYYDIKLADNEAHKRYCGRPNEIILRNIWQPGRGGRSRGPAPYSAGTGNYRDRAESFRDCRFLARLRSWKGVASPVQSHGVGQMRDLGEADTRPTNEIHDT